MTCHYVDIVFDENIYNKVTSYLDNLDVSTLHSLSLFLSLTILDPQVGCVVDGFSIIGTFLWCMTYDSCAQ